VLGKNTAKIRGGMLNMNWFVFCGWVVFGMITLSAICTVLTVGQERTPVSPKLAAVSIVVDALVLIWLYIAITRI